MKQDQHSPQDCRAWWAATARTLAEIAKQAPDFLPSRSGDDTMPWQIAQDVVHSLNAATAAADSATGAYGRQVEPAQPVPTAQPAAYTPLPPPPADGWAAHAPSQTRGWGT